MNYDASQVGVPYKRAHLITIDYPDGGRTPSVDLGQSLAVKLADGTVRKLENLESIGALVDFAKAMEPIPLVDPETSEPIGKDTNLQEVFMCVLAYVRHIQRESDKAQPAE